MTGQSRPVNQRTSKWLNGLGRFQPRELHKHLLHGSQLYRSTSRQEFEQLHQAWPWSGLARFGPTTPTRARRLSDASVDPTDARKATVRRFGRSDQSRIIPGDDIIPDERGVMVRNAARFGLGVGSGQR
jgi:hypothetical protein